MGQNVGRRLQLDEGGREEKVEIAVDTENCRVGPVGLEPTTHGLKVRCSTN